MSDVRRYLAEIGRRGGMKSRRTLDPDTAREMVRIREARRVAKRQADLAAPHVRQRAYPADTSAEAGAVQDALLRRLSSREKLAHVVQLSRMVETLALEGVRQRHPDADAATRRFHYAELLLGNELAARVYGPPRAGA